MPGDHAGSLVEQRQDELWHKFALEFRILTGEMIDATSSSNPFSLSGTC